MPLVGERRRRRCPLKYDATIHTGEEIIDALDLQERESVEYWTAFATDTFFRTIVVPPGRRPRRCGPAGFGRGR